MNEDFAMILSEQKQADIIRKTNVYTNRFGLSLTDDELISFMRKAFEEECQGSLEYLEETILDEFARKIRIDTRKFMGRYTR